MSGDHRLDDLSALVDGELAEAEAAGVVGHVSRCEECALELDHIRRVRNLVRSLPDVEPPGRFYEGLLRAPRQRRAGVLALAASAAASALLIAVSSPGDRGVAPEVTRIVDAHAGAASTNGDLVSNLVPAAVPVTFEE